MEKILYLIEFIIIAIVLIIQISLFIQNKKRIQKLKELYPHNIGNVLRVGKPDDKEVDDISYIKITSSSLSKEFSDILVQTNNYLKSRPGSGIDYQVLQDIAEKKSNSQEDNIQNNINIPLYVGLMATFLGVSVGLLQFVFNQSQDAINSSTISSFLFGVLIAMIGSFFGLFLTVISNLFFNKCLVERNYNKEQYYDFLRRELLPIANVGIGETLTNLAGNLEKFNKEFSTNISSFKGTIGNITKNIDSQVDFLKHLNQIDVKKIARANLVIFEKIESVSDVFQKIADAYDRIDQHYKEADDAVDKFVKSRIAELESLTELTSQNTNEFFDKWKQNINNQEQHFIGEMHAFFQSLTEEKTKFYNQLNNQVNYLDFMEAVKPLVVLVNEIQKDTKETKYIVDLMIKKQSKGASKENETIMLNNLINLNENISALKESLSNKPEKSVFKSWVTFGSELSIIGLLLIAIGYVMLFLRSIM
ncbi:MAG: hypothetical protein EAZ85_03070 [Bacteroidetes bacterium]|nr:MAG: hypothetical protein EAZ85_03070 [Bacteroidota bacterium]